MSTKYPVIAVTGSSGAGTSTVMKSFAHIFRREGIKAQVIEGDSFHRYNRVEMRGRVKAADAGEEFRRAEAAFRGAIKQNPQRVPAYLHLGRTLFVQEKYPEAAVIYGEALKIDPGNKPLYLQLASAREMAGDKVGAVEALELLRAMEDDPQAIQMIDNLIARMRAKQ